MRRSTRSRSAVGRVLSVLVAASAIAAGPSSAAGAQESDGASSDASLRSLNAGNGFLARGLNDLAEAEYRAFLSAHGAHPQAAQARYGLGVSLYRQNKPEAAAAELALLSAVDRFEFAAEAAALLGQCLMLAGKPADAEAAYARVLDRFGDHELADNAAGGRVEALYVLGRDEDVLRQAAAFEQRWAESPLRERAEYFAALALVRRGEDVKAAAHLRSMIKRFPKGALAGQSRLLLAQASQRTGDLTAARDQYEQLLQDKSSPVTADALLGLGQVHYLEGNPQKAGAALDQFLKRFPDHALTPAVHLYRGLAWFSQDKFDRAVESFERIPASSEEYADDAAYWTAKTLLRQGEPQEAAQRLTKALNDFPKSSLRPEMTYDRAVAFAQAKEFAEARQAVEGFLKDFADHVLAADATFLAASVLHQAGEHDASISACNEFSRRFKDHPSAAGAAFLIAENEFLAGRFERAEKAYRAFLDAFPQDTRAADARHRRGLALFRLERFEEAEALLAEAASGSAVDGGNVSLLALGEMAYQRSDWKGAESRFREYLKSKPQGASAEDATLKLGLALQRQSRFEEAAAVYDELLRRYNGGRHRIQALFERGQCYASLNRRDDAVKSFDRVVREGGDVPLVAYALQHLAAAKLADQQPKDAADLFLQAAQRTADAPLKASATLQAAGALMSAGVYEAAEGVLSSFLKAFPDHELAPRASAQRALALARLDRRVEALKAIERTLREGGAALDAATRSALMYEKAWCLRGESRLDDAIAAYQSLIRDGGDAGTIARARLEAGELSADRGDFEAAAGLLRPLLEQARARTEGVTSDVFEAALYRLGVCEHKLSRYEDAAAALSLMIETYPKSRLAASALFFCGDAEARLGRHDAACRRFEALVESSPKDPAAEPALLRLGESLAAVQRWGKSEQAFADYLDRYPQGAHRYQADFGVGWARENQGRHEEAIQAYRKVVEAHQGPTAARAQFQIGECLFAQNKLDDAVREFLKVDILYASPEWSAAALYEAGQCFSKLGKAVEAREQFNAVVQRFSDTKWAALAAKRLGETGATVASGRDNE